MVSVMFYGIMYEKNDELGMVSVMFYGIIYEKNDEVCIRVCLVISKICNNSIHGVDLFSRCSSLCLYLMSSCYRLLVHTVIMC